MKQQLVRVAAAVPRVHLAAPKKECGRNFKDCGRKQNAHVILFPELCMTGYTCGDLFNQSLLVDSTRAQLVWLAKSIWSKIHFEGLVVVGAPVRADQQLFNCAVYLYQGCPVAVLPKINLPNYGEFNEKRWFVPASHRRSDVL
ncbi:NAD+ synthetase, partial [gut metagenome]